MLYVWDNGCDWEDRDKVLLDTDLPTGWIMQLLACSDLGRGRTPEVLVIVEGVYVKWAADAVCNFSQWFERQMGWRYRPWEFEDEPTPSNLVWQRMPEGVFQEFRAALTPEQQYSADYLHRAWPSDA